MRDRVILSHRLLSHFLPASFSRDRISGKRSETEYSDEMPTNPEFTWVVREAYCILGFFDNSSVKLRLIRVRSFRPRRNSPRRKLHPDFRPDLRARLTLTVRFHCRDFHLRVSVLLSYAVGPMDQSSLVPILIVDLHCLKFFFAHSKRRFIASFKSLLVFSFAFGWVPGQQHAIFTFPTIKKTQLRDYLFDICRHH